MKEKKLKVLKLLEGGIPRQIQPTDLLYILKYKGT